MSSFNNKKAGLVARQLWEFWFLSILPRTASDLHLGDHQPKLLSMSLGTGPSLPLRLVSPTPPLSATYKVWAPGKSHHSGKCQHSPTCWFWQLLLVCLIRHLLSPNSQNVNHSVQNTAPNSNIGESRLCVPGAGEEDRSSK